MKILEIKVLRGPNYWSVRRPKADSDETGPGGHGAKTNELHSRVQGKIGKNVSYHDRTPLQRGHTRWFFQTSG